MKSRLRRLGAMFIKELVQLRRDRLTLATMLLTPIVQLLLFGYAINVNPKELPSAVVLGDNSPQARTVIQAFKHSDITISPA
jgi:ABC-2 type transport system permease protein